MPTADDHSLAARIAEGAGSLLLEIRRQAGPDATGPDATGPDATGPDATGPDATGSDAAGGKALGHEGDRRAHELITAALAGDRPADAVLSEEGVQPGDGGTLDDDHGRRRIWIVDPLDGTREFSEGRSDFAVHVALVENGIATVGAVALPGEALVLSTAEAPSLPPPAGGRLRICVSRTRPPAEAALVAERLDAVLVPMGSAGAKAMAVVRGEADIYLHSGGQYEWDSAAPVAVVLAAGAHASRLDGTPLLYDRPDPWLPDLLVCRAELAGPVLSILRDAS